MQKTYTLEITALERTDIMEALFLAIASDKQIARTARDERDKQLALESIERMEILGGKLIALRKQGAPTQITTP